MSSSALRADLQVRPCMSYFQDLWEQRASAARSEALLCRVSPQSRVSTIAARRCRRTVARSFNACPGGRAMTRSVQTISVRQRHHAHGGASLAELTSVVQLHRSTRSRWLQHVSFKFNVHVSASQCTGGLRAARRPWHDSAVHDSPHLSSHDVMLPRSSRAVPGAM